MVTEQIHLRDYLRVLRKRLRLIACLFLVVVAAVAVGTFVQRPIYRATTKALIEREGPRVVTFQDAQVQAVDSATAEFFQSQVQIINSRPVVERVFNSLSLLKRKPELSREVDPIAAFLKAVTVAPITNTRLIEIQVEDPDPRLAAEIANALASAYVSQNFELKLSAARDALTWLTAQVNDLKAKVNESEFALQRYREQAGLVQIEEKQSLAAKKLGEFNSAYLDARAKRLEMEMRVAELRKAPQQPEVLESSPVVVNNLLIQRLKGQRVELEIQLSKLLKVYKEKHPEVLKVKSQLDEIAQKIREEVERLARSVESEYNVLRTREAAMLSAVNQYRDEAQSLAQKEVQYGILKREVESSKQIYEVLLKRLKETSLSQGLDTSNVRIVEPAVAPKLPVRPRKLLNLALAAVVGLGLGVFLAFFVEYMDSTVRTPEQAERILGVPVLGLIPVIPPRAPGRS